MRRERLILMSCVAGFGAAITNFALSGFPNNFANAGSRPTADAVLGYAEFSESAQCGYKAIIFDNGTGYVFRSAAPNRVNTWKIAISDREFIQLRNAFLSNSFYKLAAKIKSKNFDGTNVALFIATDEKYHEVKNFGGANSSFKAVKSKFQALIEQKTRTAQRVPITDMLYASLRYKDSHPIDSPKARLVRNITSDFCRSLASKQDLDYKLAKAHFLPNRYLQDVDTFSVKQ
jgi:hypothetical protein